jgi:carnitine O-acetyltransferase
MIHRSIANWKPSIQFNIVCKHLGAERMSFFLNEAAGDIRDMLMPSLEAPKAKL